MKIRKSDPVDLMLEGRMREATEIYLSFYLEALESGDHFIRSELISQLHFSVAGQIPGTEPESVSKEIEQLVIGALRERRIEDDRHRQVVSDDLAIARKGLSAGKRRSEISRSGG